MDSFVLRFVVALALGVVLLVDLWNECTGKYRRVGVNLPRFPYFEDKHVGNAVCWAIIYLSLLGSLLKDGIFGWKSLPLLATGYCLAQAVLRLHKVAARSAIDTPSTPK